MVLRLLYVLLLNHFHPGLADDNDFVLQDISIDGSIPLEVPSNYGFRVHFTMINVTIWNPTVDTYKLLAERVKILSFKNCSVSKIFFLPLIDELVITSTGISEIKIADGNNITEGIKATNTSLKSIPTNISKLTNLLTVEWSDNEIGTLDLSVLNGLERIMFFELTRCSISEVIDQNEVNLPSLVGLRLDGNQISHIETQRWIMPNLRHLHLENNQLTQLPDVKQFRKLNTLYLEHNLISTISHSEWTTIAHVSYLYLSYNRILHLDSSEPIHFRRLIHLTLDRNQFRTLDISNWKMPRLEYLDVEFNQLRLIEGFASIAEGLSVFGFAGNPWECEWVHFAMVDLKEELQRAWAKSC